MLPARKKSLFDQINAAQTLVVVHQILTTQGNCLNTEHVVQLYGKLNDIVLATNKKIPQGQRFVLRDLHNTPLYLLTNKALQLFEQFSHYQIAQICQVLNQIRSESQRFQRRTIGYFANRPVVYGDSPYIVPILANHLLHAEIKDNFWKRAILNFSEAFRESKSRSAKEGEKHTVEGLSLLRSYAQMAYALSLVNTQDPRWELNLSFIAYAVRNLGLIEAPYDDKIPEVIQLAHSMALLGVKDKSCHEDACCAIEQILNIEGQRFQPPQMQQMLQYLFFLKSNDLLDARYERLIEIIKTPYLNHLRAKNISVSEIQSEINIILKYSVPNENIQNAMLICGFIVYGVLPDKKICFDVVGLNDNYFEGEGIHLAEQTKLKHKILRSMGWVVVDIAYSDWKLLDSPDEKFELIHNKYSKGILHQTAVRLKQLCLTERAPEEDKDPADNSHKSLTFSKEEEKAEKRKSIAEKQLNPEAAEFVPLSPEP